MIHAAPTEVGDRWIIVATDDETGDQQEFGYPTEFAATEAFALLTGGQPEPQDEA